MWTYKRTNKTFQGLTVHKAYCFGEFAGYRYKERTKQLKMYRDKNFKAYYKEVNVGWHYTPFVRMSEDSEGNRIFLSWEELAKQFENKQTKKKTA
ncbi:hypothetical protein [Halobacillus litoralis]|uniref:hypothetical protein n=1 Tax=Halobacillus litoralis TaxID=45668 RepID=UPI001CD1C13F|nr:hypothetical protein [Halobacillus litoralis]MCA1021608.1 hypothetical protein [Halobacillus litoralis]